MRYNNRVDLIILQEPADDLHDVPRPIEVKDVPCLIIPITNTQELSVYGLLSSMAYEIHIKNPIGLADRVKIEGIYYTVNKTFVNRKTTILIVSGDANG